MMRQHHDGVDIVELERPVAAPGLDLPLVGGPLLSSKLAVPSLPAVRVDRPRLHGLLDICVGATVTQVCAPAGWGKTDAVASWIQARADRPAAWLCLEPGDDVCRLWSFVYAGLGLPVEDVDSAPLPVAPVAQRLSGLDAPMVLVLDNFHHLGDAASLDAIEFLVRHGAGRLRLVLLTRVNPALPLERWRLAGELADIGADELALTPDETAELLAAYGHHPPDAAVAALHAHYEGWPAVLRLAALAVAGSPRTVDVDGIVAAAGPAIRGYLRRELLADQPAVLREALLRTAILDRLYPDLVGAMTLRADGERILADLERRQVFGETLGTQPPSHRYRRVVADLLRHELAQAPEDVPGLHRRAAAWHEHAGLIGDALRHALAGRDFPHAVRLMAEHWPELILCPHGTVSRPEPPTGSDGPMPDDAKAALAWAAAHIAIGDATRAGAHLIRAGASPDALPAARIALELARARLAGDVNAAASGAERLLDLATSDRLDGAPPGVVGVHTSAALGMALLARGDHAEAHETLSGTLATAQRLGLPCAAAVCASGLAFLNAASGLLREAERTANVALAAPPCPGQSTRPHCGYAYAALALVAIERHRLDDAEANLRLAADLDDDPSLAEVVSVLRAHPDPARGVLPMSAGDGGVHRAVQLDVGLTEAVAAHGRGDRRGAALGLEQVLAAAEPDGFRRVFVRAGPAGRDLLLAHLDTGTAYWKTVNELIAAIDSAGPAEPATAELPESLTQREVTVLRYLQSVLSNAEIASDMCVSVNTVKTHVRNIYRKLDTTRRRDTVRRARQLHLL